MNSPSESNNLCNDINGAHLKTLKPRDLPSRYAPVLSGVLSKTSNPTNIPVQNTTTPILLMKTTITKFLLVKNYTQTPRHYSE